MHGPTPSVPLLVLVSSALLASPAQAVCGDGVLQVGEACDDGGLASGDGCTPTCAFEPLCLVARSDALQVVRVDPGGALAAIGSPEPVGDSIAGAKGAACGRTVFFSHDGPAPGVQSTSGYAVGPGGGLSFVGRAAGGYAELHCDPERSLLLGWTGSWVGSFQVGPAGELTAIDARSVFCFPVGGDVHPLDGDLYTLCSTPYDDLDMYRYAADGSGTLTLAGYDDVGRAKSFLDVGAAFTADTSLVIPNVRMGPRVGSQDDTHCFGWFPGPVSGSPASGPELVCDGPFATPAPDTGYQAFVPHPHDGSLFYYQSAGALHTGRLTATEATSLAQITPVHDTRELITAFDGQLLLSLGQGEIASYAIGAGGVGLSHVQTLALGAEAFEAGVLLPCAGLVDSDGDGHSDAEDNCVAVANADQADANAGADDDAGLPGVQHYGDACDIDLDDDGVVGSSDFFGVFRPCVGAAVASRPECAIADLDGDGQVASADFFSRLRPALGSAPGPGTTE